MSAETLLVTAALPYANGSIHLGHLVEYIQADIFVRFQKMNGRNTLYFCADDTHGAPVMIRAKSEGVAPEQIIERYADEHKKDFADFYIEFDNYHSTNSAENKELSEEIFLKLRDGGHIFSKQIEQTYCEHDRMFLPDRFVRGVCPKCGAKDQYGDSCDSCGSHYASTELVDSRCSICGSSPTRKSSEHYFFRVSDFVDTLDKFMESGALKQEVKNFLRTWLKEGLRDWDISRDGPYFGFKIPGEEDKYFYVWLDAPIGYISATKNWTNKNNADFDELWRSGGAEIIHFIGKDIVYFHTLFWIPMLTGSGFKLPNRIQVHGFLTVNGEKMSKTKGTFINARTYLNHLDPELLRYYYASKLKNSVDDIDLNFQDFVFRVNAELVNKIANLGSRTISILNKNKQLENRLGKIDPAAFAMINEMSESAEAIAKMYELCEFSAVIKKAARMADMANSYIDKSAPWTHRDDPERLREILTAGVNALRLITIYLKPVVPRFVKKVERILKIEPLRWSDADKTCENHTVGKFERLAERVDYKSVEKIMDECKEASSTQSKTEPNDSGDVIEFDDFLKVDLRTAKILTAEKIEKADKLLRLTVELEGKQRTLVAGIAKHYEPEELIGKTVIVVANLKPRKVMGVRSQGMILAVNDGDTLRLVSPGDDVKSGIRVS